MIGHLKELGTKPWLLGRFLSINFIKNKLNFFP